MSTPSEYVGLLTCGAVKLKVTPGENMLQYSLEITFHIRNDLNLWVLQKKLKALTYLNYLSKRKEHNFNLVI